VPPQRSPNPASRDAGQDAPSRQRLLEASERLIADGGVEALSMRAVTQAAGLSVSAANYHFGSKDALVRETLLRALGPLGAQRLRRLDALEAAAAVTGTAPSVEALLEAYLRPAFELRSREGTRSYRLLWARLHLGTSAVAEELKRELLNPAFQRYLDAIARALSDRDRDGLALSLQLALGATLHALVGYAEALADVPPLRDEALIARLVRFGADGIRASAPRRADAATGAGSGGPA